MGETLEKGINTMSQPFFGSTQFIIHLLPVLTTNIFEFTTPEQIPDSFLGGEFLSPLAFLTHPNDGPSRLRSNF